MAKSTTKFGTYEQLMEGVDPALVEIATHLRNLAFEMNPDAVEVVRLGDNATTLGFGPKKMSEAYIYIMPHKKWVNLGFFYGTRLNDPASLLEGTGKNLRHIKLRTLVEAQNAAVKELIAVSMQERREFLALD